LTAAKRSVVPSWYTKDESIIDPADSSIKIGSKNAVLCLTKGFFPTLSRCIGKAELKPLPRCGGAIRGKETGDLVVFESMVGAPAAAMLAENLIASGVKDILMLGLAGSISDSCKIGDIVVPTWGIREEGTSFHYYPGKEIATSSKKLNEKIVRCLSKEQAKLGGVWTTDAPYRETMKKVTAHSHRGVLAVDMETTALMMVAKYRKVDFSAMLVISDELHSGTWVPRFNSAAVERSTLTACQVAKSLFIR
jgi:uridine phosphorylase